MDEINNCDENCIENVLLHIIEGNEQEGQPFKQITRNDELKFWDSLIERNLYMGLYKNIPLIEDETPPNVFATVKMADTDAIADTLSPPLPQMNWSDYHELEVIYNWMDDLEYDFPSICSVETIGSSLEGREIKLMKISNSVAGNESVWVDAGIHAREWIGPAVNTFVADYIVRNFNFLPKCFTNKDWYFLPVANPDGYDYTHNVERLWRKNRAWQGNQCNGVDLNRNFSYGWGGKGSSDLPTSPFYRGPRPFSEPESSAMRDALSRSGVTFKVYITLHSYGQVIILPFAYRDELCADYIRLLEGATVMSKAIYESTGNTYKVGISKDVMYGAAGTSCDWSHGAAKIPFCYLIELRSRKHKFNLPKEEIQETCNEILNCIKALMEFVDNQPLSDNEYT